MPQDCRDVTLYSWVARPQARLAPSRAGGSSEDGDTITGVLVSTEPTCWCSQWYPMGRSAGSSKVASPISLPSRSKGALLFSS